jgi:prepilin-type N-terminal cleavage/methylation domain-containing protein
MQSCASHNCSSGSNPEIKSSLFRLYANSQGFNLIELMIVVAIVGILASVAIPLYMGYVQKSRFRSLVYPGLHIIETNIGLYYSVTNTLPESSMLTSMWAEADTTYFHVSLPGGGFVVTIDSPEPSSKLSKLHGLSMTLTPKAADFKISSWELSGALAEQLGISTQ